MAKLMSYEEAAGIAPKNSLMSYEEAAGLPVAEPSGLARRALGDTGVSLAKGVIGLPEAAVGLANLPTVGLAGKAAQAIGFAPKEWKGALDEYYSPEQKAANAVVQQAEGFGGKLKAAIQNPSVIAGTVAESLPLMLGGGAIARALPAGMSAVARGALGEGIVGAGSASEQMRQSSEDGLQSPKQAIASLASGAGTAAFGALGGKVAQKFGIADPDTMLAGGTRQILTDAAENEAKKNLPRRIAEAGLAEGVMEELPQSMWEQAAQNYGTGQPLAEGVPEAAAMGMLAGGVMGAAGGAISRPSGPISKASETAAASGATFKAEFDRVMQEEQALAAEQTKQGPKNEQSQEASTQGAEGVSRGENGSTQASGKVAGSYAPTNGEAQTAGAEQPAGGGLSQPQIVQPEAATPVVDDEFAQFAMDEAKSLDAQRHEIAGQQAIARRAKLEAVDGRVEAQRKQQAEANRLAVMDSIDLPAMSNPVAAFEAGLARAGIRQSKATQAEVEQISRRVSAIVGLSQPEPDIPSLPNELTLPEKQKSQAAPSGRRMQVLIRRVQSGARIKGGKLLNKNGMVTANLTADEEAALQQYVKQKEPAKPAAQPYTPEQATKQFGTPAQPTTGGILPQQSTALDVPSSLQAPSKQPASTLQVASPAADKAKQDAADQEAKDKKAAEKQSLERKVKARAANLDNFQFGEDSKAAAKPMGGLFDQDSQPAKTAESATLDSIIPTSHGLNPETEGKTWRQFVEGVFDKHGRASYLAGASLHWPSGTPGKSYGARLPPFAIEHYEKYRDGEFDRKPVQPAKAERGEVGASLTKEQRKSVLKTLTDVYKTKQAPREHKGVDNNGNDKYGYVHSPDLFEKSDITGAMIRYVVTLPDGRIAHPTELFADYTQSDIDKAMAESRAEEARNADNAKWLNEKIDNRAKPSLIDARHALSSILEKTGDKIDRGIEFYSEGEGKWFVVQNRAVANSYAAALSSRGYKEVSKYSNDAPQGEKPRWFPKEYADGTKPATAESPAQPAKPDDIESAPSVTENELKSFVANGKIPHSITLYHGSAAKSLTGFNTPIVFLAANKEDAGMFATHPVLNHGATGDQRVYSVTIPAGKIEDISEIVDDSLDGDRHVNEVINEAIKDRLPYGYKYVAFNHPGFGDEYFLAVVSGDPKSLKIVGSESAKPEPAEKPEAVTPAAIVQQADAIDPANIADFGEKIGGARKDTAKPIGSRGRIEREKDERPVWARPFSVSQVTLRRSGLNAHEVGKWEINEESKKYKGVLVRASRTIFDTEQEALNAIPLVVMSRRHNVRGYKENGKELFGIFRNVTEKKRAMVRGGFESDGEAKAFMAGNPQEIIEHKFPYPERPWLDKIERIGDTVLTGNVTTKQFQETFGFRGGEFGNWNMGGDGQAALNHAYESLMDLAKAIGVPPRALSLNGELAIAFGARGNGGKKSARAHYEPGAAVINLTKIKGAGSLAHEWWHAVDHYFARSGSSFKDSFSVVADGHGYKGEARPELVDAIKKVVDTINYSNRSTTTDAALVRQNAKDRTAAAIKNIDYYLADLRNYLTNDEYRKNGKVATAAQLAEWDTFVAKLKDGQEGEQVYVENPSKIRGAMGFMIGTNIRDMNALYKSVVGRSFLKVDPSSTGRRLAWSVKAIAENKQRVDAQDDVTTNSKGRSEYYLEARKIDEQHVGDYWSSPEEMGARAFESYIFDKIIAGEGRSDYLVYGVENRYYAALDMKPYPEGDERTRINESFDALFDTVQAKESGDGRVMLFNRNGQMKISPADSAVYEMARDGKSAAEILEFLGKASRNGFNRYLANALKSMGVSSTVKLDSMGGWNFNRSKQGPKYAAAYSPKTDTVALFTPREAERHALHEFTHAATLKAIEAGGRPALEMKRLFQHVQATGKLDGMYGMSLNEDGTPNLDEFVAEAFSNPEFQRALMKVAAPRAYTVNTAWDAFVRFVAKLVGLKSPALQSALDKAMVLGAELMRENAKLSGKGGDTRFSQESDTINVDGTERPRTNSNGKPIAAWKSSPTISRESVLSANRIGLNEHASGNIAYSMWYSPEHQEAYDYGIEGVDLSVQKTVSGWRRGESGFGGQSYNYRDDRRERGLSMMSVDGSPAGHSEMFMSDRKKYEYKGILLPEKGSDGEPLIIPFGGENIDREIFDNGEFSPDNPDIRFNVESSDQWVSSSADNNTLDDIIYKIANKQIDLRRTVQDITKKIGAIADEYNPELAETLYHGKAANETKNFLDFELRPLIRRMLALGVDTETLETYLWARHAEERNEQIAKINPRLPDGGSGLTNTQARQLLSGQDVTIDGKTIKGVPQDKLVEIGELASMSDAIIKKSRELLVDSGLESKAEVDSWSSMYQHYVPLHREEFADDRMTGKGLGMSIKGPSGKRAIGSEKPVSNILASIVSQREMYITRAEKNKVGNATYGLATIAPNEDFWQAIDPMANANRDAQQLWAKIRKQTEILASKLDGDEAMEAIIDAMKAQHKALMKKAIPGMKKVKESLESLGLPAEMADRILAEPKELTINKRTGMVVERVNPLLRHLDNVLATRINGRDVFVVFNARNKRASRMAMAMKNLDADNLGFLLGNMAKATRYFAAINTQFNPIFGVTNFTRDVQTAMLNLSSTPLAGYKAEIAKRSISAMHGIYRDLRDHRAGKAPSSKWAETFEQFKKHGGATGYRDMFETLNDRAKDLQDELKKMGMGKARRMVTLGQSNPVFAWLSDYNEMMENSVRVAAFSVAIEQGMSPAQAASLAKELTVNFNKKGQVAAQAGAMYAFFNAAVQGTSRIAQTLATLENGKPRLTPVGKKIIAGGVMVGVVQAILGALAGWDDEEPPQFVRERSLIIPIGDHYVSIPMPLGYNVLPNIGRITTEFALSGFKDPAKRISSMVNVLADTFNPIGNAGMSLQTITPTVIDPIAALSENKDWTGKPIKRMTFNEEAAGYKNAKDTATAWSKLIAEGLNYLTGGTEHKAGLMSPTPDQIDYLIGQVTGGVGREVSKIVQTGSSVIYGEELPLYKVPLAGKFVGSTTGQAAESSRFYENLRELKAHKAEIDGRRKAQQDVAGYLRDNPDARLVPIATRIESRVQELRRAKRALLEKNAPQDQVKAIDERITAHMKMLNGKVGELQRSSK